MTDTRYAPIAIFAFNRPNLVRKLLESLTACPEWSSSKVFVFIDGPRTDKEAELTTEVGALFEALGHADMTLITQDANKGLKASLSAGISQVCVEYDRVVVLEDDLELSPDALAYFNAGLDAYEYDLRVWSICGDIPELRGFGCNEAHFMSVGSSWGWATWANRWAHFSPQCPLDTSIRSTRIFRDRFDVHGLRNFCRMLTREEAGLISSWYVHWHLTIVRNNGLCLFPPVPMLRNTGFGSGTHASRLSLPRLFGLGEKELGRFNFSLPGVVMLDIEFLQRVIKSPEWRLLRFNAQIGSLRRRLRSLVRQSVR